MNIIKRVTISVRLDASETFKWHTRTGEILVSHLRFDAEDFAKEIPRRSAWADGRAIKKDGELALFNRNDIISFSDIPPHIISAVRDEIQKRTVVL